MLNLDFLALGMPGFDEWIVIAIIGVLVFGRKLPEVGKNLGKGIVEFKKGLKGIDDEIERQSSIPTQNNTPTLPPSTTVASSQHKFDPITGAALDQPAVPPGAKFDPFTGKPLAAE